MNRVSLGWEVGPVLARYLQLVHLMPGDANLLAGQAGHMAFLAQLAFADGAVQREPEIFQTMNESGSRSFHQGRVWGASAKALCDVEH